MIIDLTLKGEKATYDLASALGDVALVVVKQLGDGFQPIQDTAAIGMAIVADLLPVAGSFAAVKAELAEDKVAFLNSWLVAGEELYEKVVAK